jgi:hypothetical protein
MEKEDVHPARAVIEGIKGLKDLSNRIAFEHGTTCRRRTTRVATPLFCGHGVLPTNGPAGSKSERSSNRQTIGRAQLEAPAAAGSESDLLVQEAIFSYS